MKVIMIVLLLGLVLLPGCAPTTVDPTTDVLVGTVNGKPLRRVEITGGGSVHYVYYFPSDPTQPVTTNYRAGKVTYVVVSIDGKPVSTNTILLENR